MQRAKILFFPNEAKISKKSNLIPVYVRISKGGQKAESKLNVSVKPEGLIHWNRFTERLDIKDNPVNKKLEKYRK